ncbi:OmpA family protein, partial [Aurantimonas coralicida]|uniref:OmpA family protein n=1 Tax=Aurantimonas coralicida TaxID=182270 RepID=UPI003514A1CF
SVSQLLASQGVDPRRLNPQGFGESQPVAYNDTESGRAQNRRVEIAISPLTAG